jgi:hypothetical protein
MAILTASEFGALGDSAPLHLPMPGLFADVEAGSGAVALTDDFLEASPRLRLRGMHPSGPSILSLICQSPLSAHGSAFKKIPLSWQFTTTVLRSCRHTSRERSAWTS